MIFKQGVKIQGLSPEIVMACLVADTVWRDHGRPEGVTITSVVDGVHSKKSLHYAGNSKVNDLANAIDCRTRYFNDDVKLKVLYDLKLNLTDEFDVVSEDTHIHVEFDPKTPKYLLKNIA